VIRKGCTKRQSSAGAALQSYHLIGSDGQAGCKKSLKITAMRGIFPKNSFILTECRHRAHNIINLMYDIPK
jgi:hypothetical protein